MMHNYEHKYKHLLFAFVISLATYLLFYYPTLSSRILISGGDPFRSFYPSRFYLFKTITSGVFPFWTEKIFSGYPIYADPERAFLNPINILSVLLFGPFTSYKILHLVFYLAGSLSLYLFLRRKSLGNLLSYTAANLTYFFSLFMLYHQQHFNMILTLSLLPLYLYLTDLYAESKRRLFVVLTAIAVGLSFYWGSFQSLMLGLIPPALYLLTCGVKNIRHLMLFCLLVLAIVMPQLLPTAQLYLRSVRAEQSEIFSQGSFMPFSFINVVYPFVFGTGGAYKWNMVDEGYLIHETYVYVGIVVMILGALGFSVLRSRKLKYLCALCVLLFIILSLAGYVPYAKELLPVFFQPFRYWGRSVVLLNFALAVCVASFFANFEKIEKAFLEHVFIFVALLAVFLVFIQAINFGNLKLLIPFSLILHKAMPIDMNLFVWVLLLLLTLAVLVLWHYRLPPLPYKHFFLFFIFADAVFFGKPVVSGYLRDISEVYFTHASLYKNSRQVGYDNSYYWNINLYSRNAGIFGYSQLVLKPYDQLLRSLGMKSLEFPERKLDVMQLAALGVGSANPIVSGDGVSNLVFGDGQASFDYNRDKSGILQTKIQYYPGWEVFVDGVEVPLVKSDVTPFISLGVPAGSHHIALKFIPRVFYLALVLSGCLFIVTVGLFFPYGKKRKGN